MQARQVLLCVDCELDLLVFDIDDLAASREDFGLRLDLNLFDNAHLFDLVSKHLDESTSLTLLESQQDLMEQKLASCWPPLRWIRERSLTGWSKEISIWTCSYIALAAMPVGRGGNKMFPKFGTMC